MGRGQFMRCTFYIPSANDTISAEIGYRDQFRLDKRSTHAGGDGSINQVYFNNSDGGYVNSVLLNGKIFNNCIWTECINSNDCAPAGITKYYFAKHIGLAAYVKNNILWTVR